LFNKKNWISGNKSLTDQKISNNESKDMANIAGGR
jgi:hypothetical protein